MSYLTNAEMSAARGQCPDPKYKMGDMSYMEGAWLALTLN